MVPQSCLEVIFYVPVHPLIYTLDGKCMSPLSSYLLCSNSSWWCWFLIHWENRSNQRGVPYVPPAYLPTCPCAQTLQLLSTSVDETTTLFSKKTLFTNAPILFLLIPSRHHGVAFPLPLLCGPLFSLCCLILSSIQPCWISPTSHSNYQPIFPLLKNFSWLFGVHHSTKWLLSRLAMTSMLLNPMLNHQS